MNRLYFVNIFIAYNLKNELFLTRSRLQMVRLHVRNNDFDTLIDRAECAYLTFKTPF